MTNITSKSTKAEILAAYEALLAQSQAETITPAAARNTAAVVIRETQALVTDCYKAGTLLHQWISGIVAELSQPVLRSNA
jgi:hypothetical protein